MEKEIEYTQKEASNITGISSDLLRTYEREFNLQIARTSGGHRRYTKEDIDMFKKIRKMMKEDGLSYRQISLKLNKNTTEDRAETNDIHQVSKIEEMIMEQRKMIETLTEKIDYNLKLQSILADQIKNIQLKNNNTKVNLVESQSTTAEQPKNKHTLHKKKWYAFWK